MDEQFGHVANIVRLSAKMYSKRLTTVFIVNGKSLGPSFKIAPISNDPVVKAMSNFRDLRVKSQAAWLRPKKIISTKTNAIPSSTTAGYRRRADPMLRALSTVSDERVELTTWNENWRPTLSKP